jgi:hypothetical protein
MAQGWAGNATRPEAPKCALCIKEGKSIDAVTQVTGTLVCLAHVEWIPLPVNPPFHDD